MARVFGHVPGVQTGQIFDNRRAAYDAGVHRQLQAGIVGTPAEGAESIVLNKGYKDDEDYKNVIIYTGHGGQDDRGNQIDNQSFDDPGNAALVRSKLEQNLVRVIRGPKGEEDWYPTHGYRYDGLFTIEDFWTADGLDGFKICRFLMIEVMEDDAGQLYLGHSDEADEPAEGIDPGPAPRVPNTGTRIARQSAVADRVKAWHSDQCQICGQALTVAGGATFSQGAHIRGLGRPHYGPDTTNNVLCLCPNDHFLFDNGGYYIEDDLTVINAVTGAVVGPLRQHQSHRINMDHIRYHRSHWLV